MLEILGVIAGLVYIWLEIQKKNAMWVIGVIMASAYIVLFAQEKLYAAMGLQAYYLVVSIYGWWKWRSDAAKCIDGCTGIAANVSSSSSINASINEQDCQEIDTSEQDCQEKMLLNKLGWKEALITSGLAVMLYFLLTTVLSEYTAHPQPKLDSLISSLSVLGTYWLSRSYIQHWYIWITVNILSVGMYLIQGLHPTSVLYLVYVVGAIYGYYHWRKMAKA